MQQLLTETRPMSNHGMFADAVQAVKWAEELASRPDLRSQIGKIIDGGVAGRDSPMDWDVAMTISARLSRCSPKITGLAMKSIYGGVEEDRDRHVGDQIGLLLAKKVDKPVDMMQRLGVATIKAERAMTVFGDRYPLKRMAAGVGISRNQFTTTIGWLQARSESMALLRAWVDQAEREMTEWLDGMGWLWRAESE